MAVITYKSQAEIITKPYLSIKDIRGLVPIGYCQARRIITEVRAEQEAEGKPLFKTKELLAPTNAVLMKLGLNATSIRKQARECCYDEKGLL